MLYAVAWAGAHNPRLQNIRKLLAEYEVDEEATLTLSVGSLWRWCGVMLWQNYQRLAQGMGVVWLPRSMLTTLVHAQSDMTSRWQGHTSLR
jgi:hypothetical protein